MVVMDIRHHCFGTSDCGGRRKPEIHSNDIHRLPELPWRSQRFYYRLLRNTSKSNVLHLVCHFHYDAQNTVVTLGTVIPLWAGLPMASSYVLTANDRIYTELVAATAVSVFRHI